MCNCEDRPCCACDQEVSRYDHEPDADYERERVLESIWLSSIDEDEDEDEEVETDFYPEDQDFLTD
jgi:hypothetical protein